MRRTAADLVGMVNAVLFSADDIELVHGPPSLRRRYLDILMSQLDRSYLKALQRYQRIVHQRNRLLRMLQERRAKEDELAFWDQELIKEGSWIVQRRDGAMSTLGGLCRELQLELTGGAEELTVEYRPSVPLHSQAGTGEDTAQNFAKALEASRKREFQLGSTVVGPHRDDFSLLVDGSDMGTYASRGQARTIALTLKLAEAAYLGSARADGPIVLLDDVLSELDSFRRDRVLDKSLQYQQVIISATDLEPIQKSHLSDAACYSVEGGHVTRPRVPSRLHHVPRIIQRVLCHGSATSRATLEGQYQVGNVVQDVRGFGIVKDIGLRRIVGQLGSKPRHGTEGADPSVD